MKSAPASLPLFIKAATTPGLRLIAVAFICLCLAACGGGGDSDFFAFAVNETPASTPAPEPETPAPPLYVVSGTVTGLADNEKLTLLNNGGDKLTITAEGPFRFATALPANTAYAVTVGAQPFWQNCTVGNGTGTIRADVTQVTVTCVAAQAQVSTLAGTYGAFGRTDGTGQDARFFRPTGIASDLRGNLYVADEFGHTIRKIDASGVVGTVAGSGALGSSDGVGRAASFRFPGGIAVDSDGNVYVADRGNHTIRKMTPSGEVTTLAGSGVQGASDGPGLTASFRSPKGVAVGPDGNVYVADTGNHKIRKISPSGEVTTLAGSGTAGADNGTDLLVASFRSPSAVTVDKNGNVYVADTQNHCIRKITPSGVVSTLAGSMVRGSGDGSSADASFNGPQGLVVDGSGNVFVADSDNFAIRKITPNGVVTTLAGSPAGRGPADGLGTNAQFDYPVGMTTDVGGALYVTEYVGPTVRKIAALR